MKGLTAEGISVTDWLNVKCTDAITLDNDRSSWRCTVFNMNTANGLSYCVFFYNFKTFGLRGNGQHKNLDTSQHAIKTDKCGNSFLLLCYVE